MDRSDLARALPGRRPRFLTLGACALVAVAGCDLVTGSSRPEQARVVVEGAFPDSVRIVTSHNFFFGFDETGLDSGIELVEADTVVVPLPFERTYDLAPTYWFMVRAHTPDSGAVTMRLRVDVDGRTEYDRTQEMEASFLQYYLTHN